MVEIKKLIKDRMGFWRYALMRFIHDEAIQRSAGLSYTTLLAMVPFLAVALSILSAFPVFDQFKDQIMNVVLNNFLPSSGAQVTDYLGKFLQNTGQMTAIGTIVLALTAVMLLSSIEGAMNDVFRVTTPRKLLSKLVVFWTLLTVGPMLLGLSLSLASYIFAMRNMVGGEALSEQIGQLTFLAPFLLSTVAFTLLFIGMPNRSVEIKDGFWGGLVAAVLFETLKKGFAFYVTNFPTYQTIYGAVAIVPIFLLWMYLTWIVIMLGAHVSAGRSEWRAARAAGLIPDPSGAVPGHMERLIAVMRVLEYLQTRFQNAEKPATYRRMMREVKLGGRDLNWALAALRREKLIDRSEHHRWLLSGDLSRITLFELMNRLRLFLDYDRLLVVSTDAGWPGVVREHLIELEEKNQSVLDMDIASLLDTPKPDDKECEVAEEKEHSETTSDVDAKDMAQIPD